MNQEPIASVDSTTNGVIKCTVRKNHVGSPLGCGLYTVTAGDDRLLCQAGNVETTNAAHMDESLRPMVAHLGEVPYYSGKADNERISLSVLANYRSDEDVIGQARRNPSSGTPVFFISGLSEWEREKEFRAVIGRTTSGNALVSLVNRSFKEFPRRGEKDDGSGNEALHEAWFGQNGSAKTIAALQRLALRLCQHSHIGALLLDVKGDLQGKEFRGRDDFSFNFYEVLRQVGIEPAIYPLSEVAVDGVEYFVGKLTKWIVDLFSAKSDKAETIAYRVRDMVVNDTDKNLSFTDEFAEAVIRAVWNVFPSCYAKAKEGQDKLDRHNMADARKSLMRAMSQMRGRKSISDVIKDAFDGKVVVLDVHGSDQKEILAEVVGRVRSEAKSRWKRFSRLANTIVFLDEAHRWVPQAEGDDDSRLAKSIKTGLRETRAWGVAWTIVSQSMAEISKEVLKQCHTKYFGRNLGIGADRKHLEDILGKEGMEKYEALSSSGRFFFMATGRDVNIGTGSATIDFFTFDGDSTKEIIQSNSHIFSMGGLFANV